jgi:hypothetical protein
LHLNPYPLLQHGGMMLWDNVMHLSAFDSSSENDEHMMQGIICLNISFAFYGLLLDGTDLNNTDIIPSSRIKFNLHIKCPPNICNGSTISSSSSHGGTVSDSPCADAVTAGEHSRSAGAHSRYLFPLSFFVWNVRSLFANGHEDTWLYVVKLMEGHNIGILTETRSNAERIEVLRTHLPTSLYLFASGISAHYGGVAILVKRSFLDDNGFASITESVIQEGRCIHMCLSSSIAALHLFAVYLDPSNAHERVATMRKMKAAVAPNSHNIIAGDLNFTFNPQERLSFGGEAGSPTDIDVACVAEWNLLFTDAGFKEFYQPGFTCKHSYGFSKLDKVFSDMCHAERELLEIGCNTVTHPMKLSDHHPISVRIASQQRTTGRRVPDWIAKEPELANEVFGLLGSDTMSDGCNPLDYLEEVKTAIYQASRFFKFRARNVLATTTEHKLSVTANFIRALLSSDLESAAHFQGRYEFLMSMDISSCHEGPQYDRVLEHYKELGHISRRERQKQEEQRQQAAVAAGVLSEDDLNFTGSTLNSLYEMLDKNSANLTAVADSDGNVTTVPGAMADVLCSHWQEAFTPGAIDDEVGALVCNESSDFLKACLQDVAPIEDDARKALQHSPNTGVGPDGVPYSVWRGLGDFTVQLIMAIISCFLCASADVPYWFNLAFMVFIPKDPSGQTAYGTPYYSADCTRPLSLADTINKLIANTVRIALERFASPRISFFQRGFLKGRQILDNVVELDYFAHLASITYGRAATILFDFRAAFPSVNHRFMWRVLESSGLPSALIRLIRCFYRGCTHVIRVDGRQFPGPRLLSGVRQGCPLSGLLFAIIMEPILRTVYRALGPYGHLRAYADDIGIVVHDYFLVTGALGGAFQRIGVASGLFLNVGKTIFIPLWHVASYAQIRKTITELWPPWGKILLANCGKYLGFLLGPGGRELMWKKVIAKTDRRVTEWCQLHAGTFFSILAHNHHIVPVCTYIAQLVPPDEAISKHLDKIVARMFPGPGNWTTLRVMRSLKHYGFPCQLIDLKMVSAAAMQRYYHNTALDISGMATELYLHLRAYETSSQPFPELSAWHEGAFALNLLRSIGTCAELGLSQELIQEAINRNKTDTNIRVASTQKFITTELHALVYGKAAAVNILRHRLMRWNLDLNPRASVELASNNLQVVGKTCRAAVLAAYFRTLLNGWVTARRMRSASGSKSEYGRCVFGCGHGSDSIEHYAYCRIVTNFYRKSGIAYSHPSVASFLMVSRRVARDKITLQAACLYAVYLTHNILRHSSAANPSEERVNGLFRASFARAGGRRKYGKA